MAITTTGFQAPATKREGLKPSVYENIILISADTRRLYLNLLALQVLKV